MATSILGKHPPQNKLNVSTCPRCSKWTVKGANYCHNCGFNLSGVFNAHSPAIAQNGAFGGTTTRITHNHNYKTHLVELLGITGLSIGLVWSVANDQVIIAVALIIPLAAYVTPKLVPALATSFAEIRAAWAMGPARPKNDNSVLKVEFIDDYGRPRLLSEFHRSVELRHLAWIGQRVGEGASFSRPQLTQNGVFSQGQFHQVKRDFMRLNYAIPRDPKAPNLGVILTERGKRLVKRALEEHGNDF